MNFENEVELKGIWFNVLTGETVTLDETISEGAGEKTFDWPESLFSLTVEDTNVAGAKHGSGESFFLYFEPVVAETYEVTVNNGTGDGIYEASEIVTIVADTAPSGKEFTSWTVNAGGVTLANATATTTTFTMPANAVEVTANYKTIDSVAPPTTTPDSGTTDGSTSGSTSSGTTSGTVTTTPSYSNSVSGSGSSGVTLTPSNPSAGDKVTISLSSGLDISDITVTDASGNSVTIEKSSLTGEYYFTQPTGKVTITATGTVTPAVPTNPTTPTTPDTSTVYNDVKTSDWYYTAVMFAREEGLMASTGDGNFSPDMTTSRGMIVTMLYNMAGKPATGTANFDDINDTDYYASPVAWADSLKIAAGVGGGNFDPNGGMTREQLVLMLFNYFKTVDSGSYDGGSNLAFNDAGSVSNWAAEAVAWAVANGIIAGNPDGSFVPQATATRAQVAVILQNFMKL